jgi:hypothetical protein
MNIQADLVKIPSELGHFLVLFSRFLDEILVRPRGIIQLVLEFYCVS